MISSLVAVKYNNPLIIDLYWLASLGDLSSFVNLHPMVIVVHTSLEFANPNFFNNLLMYLDYEMKIPLSL